jgi:hypothetical protein
MRLSKIFLVAVAIYVICYYLAQVPLSREGDVGLAWSFTDDSVTYSALTVTSSCF